MLRKSASDSDPNMYTLKKLQIPQVGLLLVDLQFPDNFKYVSLTSTEEKDRLVSWTLHNVQHNSKEIRSMTCHYLLNKTL